MAGRCRVMYVISPETFRLLQTKKQEETKTQEESKHDNPPASTQNIDYSPIDNSHAIDHSLSEQPSFNSNLMDHSAPSFNCFDFNEPDVGFGKPLQAYHDGISELPPQLKLVIDGVAPRNRPNAMFILKHLVHANEARPNLFKFDVSDHGIMINSKKLRKTNFCEILNLILRRNPPNMTPIQQRKLEGKYESTPGLHAFLRLLSKIGIPSSLFNNVIIADIIQRNR
jgi:hypothetical protein